ncbi:hypothetical protein KUV50_03105 [Membranicola marinus]|uniref:Uncharacterized protein n=1 Tax=Membranihabitans marinus TaxID=1227546 RepID=A0A953HL70_9BACT|nr:hypothetical protein [Membranihabitans marinus]MBY5957109.1 hypothetical protein [Membranihabitans marinus]
MIEEFKGISESEYENLKNAISYITVLIAGADGTIEDHETDWAAKVTDIRSYNLPRRLSTFYKEAGETFQEDVEFWVNKFNEDADSTMKELKFRLANLNDVFAKLDDHQLAYELYLSFRSFARHVARSTGGFLGWGAIGPEEDELIGLTMIHPIAPPIEEDRKGL